MADTGAAKLPGIPALQTSDAQLAAWAKAVQEHLEVRAGSRGNAEERTATQRELRALEARIAALEGLKPSVASLSAAIETATADPPAADQPASSGTAEVASLKGDVGALMRRVRLLETARLTVGGEPKFDAAFYWRPAEGARPARWQLQGSVGMADSNVDDVLGALTAAFYEQGRTNLDRYTNVSLNPSLRLVGGDGSDLGTVFSNSLTVPGMSQRLQAIENRFDSAGRLSPGALPLYYSSAYSPGTMFQLIDAVQYIEGKVKVVSP